MSSRDPGDIAGDALDRAEGAAQDVGDEIGDPVDADGTDLLDPVRGSEQLSEEQRRRTIRNLSRPQARGLAARASGPEFDRGDFDVSDGGELQLSDDARQRLRENEAVETGEQRGGGQRSPSFGAGVVGSAIGAVGNLPSAQFGQAAVGRGSDEAQRRAALPDVRESVRDAIEEPVPETPAFVDAPAEPLNAQEAEEVAQSIGVGDLQQVDGGRVGLDDESEQQVAAAAIDDDVPVDVTAADIEPTDSGGFRPDADTTAEIAATRCSSDRGASSGSTFSS